MRSRVKFTLDRLFVSSFAIKYKFFESAGNGHQFSQPRCENNSRLNRETPKSKFQLIVTASVKIFRSSTLAFYLNNYIAQLQIVRNIDADSETLGCQKII